jgi:hypothetical protein
LNLEEGEAEIQDSCKLFMVSEWGWVAETTSQGWKLTSICKGLAAF